MSMFRYLAFAAILMLAPVTAAAQSGQRVNPFKDAKSWAYQLTNLGAEQQKRIIDSDYDVVVVDYAQSLVTDTVEVPLTAEQVAAMKRKPDGGRRLVIAYLSIGESEDNRYYWPPEWNKKRPAWMKAESKEWKGNYLVEYWNPEWQKIIFGSPSAYVDRILKGGFDGFYIDRADAYYRFGDSKQARDRMSDFLVRLIADIRSKKPDAAIMMQNAEELLDRPQVVAAIDAIAKEDLLFGITHREELNKKVDIDYSTKLLVDAQKAGKMIFVVEYLRNPKNIETAKARMKELGFVLYYGPRGLFEIMKPGETPAAPAPRTTVERVKDKLPFQKPKPTPGARNVR